MWIDSQDVLWLFGGKGFDESTASEGHLNDMWMFDGAWTWKSGSSLVDQAATYVPGAGATPGGVNLGFGWRQNDFLYFFGGAGYAENSVNVGIYSATH
jgi:hypothetical protein